MKKNINRLCCLLIVLVLINGCKKGPDGEIGPAGPQGVVGDKGPDGDLGKVKVIATEWYTVKEADFIKAYDPKTFTSKITFSGNKINQLTENILKDGIVLVYNKVTGDDENIYLLPFTLQYYYAWGEIMQRNYLFEASAKKMECSIKFAKHVDVNEIFIDEDFRFVFIAGASGARLKDIDFKNYEAVKKAFNLED
ncbi:collagen-like protein [Emticicia sp. C21]|uniref:collagen-like triple helix repeat-containing protein n=1 Tax=Emticicia sp. C21 TaxID=2302915 RepID=UPI000E3453A4|nr:collagen-like protein [Emticicia sp. C21]RFS17149.1 collagen-like protein [Emticicia sp. C21]